MSTPAASDPTTLERQQLAAFVRALTLVASEIAFAGLFAYVIYETWNATSAPPDISGPVQATAAALAVALAAGFSSVLGISPQSGVQALRLFTKSAERKAKNEFNTELVLFLGVFVYMAVGAACGLTYLANVDQTPTLLRTVAVAFGGYVIAYIGTAYKQLSQ